MSTAADSQAAFYRMMRAQRLRQNENEVSHMVHDALVARDIAEAVAILEAYAALLEARPLMLEDLPPVTSVDWSM